MEVKSEESWKRRLSNEFEEPYFHELTDFVRQGVHHQTDIPSRETDLSRI